MVGEVDMVDMVGMVGMVGMVDMVDMVSTVGMVDMLGMVGMPHNEGTTRTLMQTFWTTTMTQTELTHVHWSMSPLILPHDALKDFKLIARLPPRPC